MVTGRSVQFQTTDSVINAYELRAVPAFSIYQGKQLLLKYEGSEIGEGIELLTQFLPMLSSSAAIYTLCIYEEFTGKINDKSPYHGSYNFKLSENTPGYNQNSGILKELSDKITLMDEKINRLEVDNDLETPEDNILNGMDRISAIVTHPMIERLLPFLMQLMPAKNIAEMEKLNYPAKMNGIPDSNEEFFEGIEFMVSKFPQSKEALNTLIDLAKNDEKKFLKILSYMNLL